MSEHYYCGRAEGQLARFLQAITENKLLSKPLIASQERMIVERCGPCSRDEGQKDCLGWKAIVPKDRLLMLGPFLIQKRLVELRVCSQLDYARSAPQAAVDWRAEPVASGNITIEVWDVEGVPVQLSRHHFDLANLDQHGPVWHLQADGNGFSPVRLDVPRWVSMPMDLILALDLLIFNYAHDTWMKLQGIGNYTNAVVDSEMLVQTAWVRRVAALFDRPVGMRTPLLRFLDNEKLPNWNPLWNPRPGGGT